MAESSHPSDPSTPSPSGPETSEETRVASRHTPAEPYTVHQDALTPEAATESGGVPSGGVSSGADPATRRRGGPDPIALVAGLVALVVAVLATTGSLQAVDPRWVLAAGAVVVGGSVLIASLRRRA